MTTSTMDITDGSGHTTVEWDPAVPAEVDNARAVFERMTGEHKHLAYQVDDRGERTQLHYFDADARRIVMVGPTQGG